MNPLALNNPVKTRDPNCGDLVTTAERELAAFFRAVTELFGSEQAERSAEDWLQELMASDDLHIDDLPIMDLPDSTREWRRLTVKASARLASRVNASADATGSLGAPALSGAGCPIGL